MTVNTDDRKNATTREPGMTGSDKTATVLRPPVDISEDAEGITLVADMPGVSKEHLNLKVDSDSLTLEGEVGIEMPEGMEALYADMRSTRYERSFTLSGELATDEIDATLQDGVLSVRIPKRADMRPRKIEIRTS